MKNRNLAIYSSLLMVLVSCNSDLHTGSKLAGLGTSSSSSVPISPTPGPTSAPTASPTAQPTSSPTAMPTSAPTASPTPTGTVPPSVFFPSGAIWTQDASTSPLDPESSQIITWLSQNGGWQGGNKTLQIDFSMVLLKATSNTPMVSVQHTSDYYSPDCSSTSVVPTFPLPVGGAIEGSAGYQCVAGDDCHLLVLDSAHQKLYESYHSNVSNNILSSECVISWDLTKVYPASGRGDQCTSTDAAGFPVAPLLFTADEVASGSINHAIRFILPNNEMRSKLFVHPASHAGGPSAGGFAPIYGAHFRLKASFDITKLSPGAQVVAKAMKKYGMFLADGGRIPLTAADDRYSTAKWSQLGMDAQSLSPIQVTDFEVIDGGPRITLDFNCTRGLNDPN